MAENTKIEWATHTFNPWRGCAKVSAGCANCYADSLSNRNPKTLGVWGPNGTRVVAAEAAWREPLKWDRMAKEAGERYRVFCASLADVFEDWPGAMFNANGNQLFKDGAEWFAPGRNCMAVSGAVTMQDVRARLFRLIDDTPNLDWLLLTKRPEDIAKMMSRRRVINHRQNPELCENNTFEPRPNLWLGTSVENKAAKSRIDILRTVPAAVRFLSIEPLIEDLGELDLSGIHLVIVGGESGHRARPMNPSWVRSIRDQCVAAGVPFFFKQWGEFAPNGFLQEHPMDPLATRERMSRVGKETAGRVLDGRTWDEFPKRTTDEVSSENRN